jgi:hypothetical protein
MVAAPKRGRRRCVDAKNYYNKKCSMYNAVEEELCVTFTLCGRIDSLRKMGREKLQVMEV